MAPIWGFWVMGCLILKVFLLFFWIPVLFQKLSDDLTRAFRYSYQISLSQAVSRIPALEVLENLV